VSNTLQTALESIVAAFDFSDSIKAVLEKRREARMEQLRRKLRRERMKIRRDMRLRDREQIDEFTERRGCQIFFVNG